MSPDDKPLSAAQIKELGDQIGKSFAIRAQAILHALKAAEGKDWTNTEVMQLTKEFHKFLVGPEPDE